MRGAGCGLGGGTSGGGGGDGGGGGGGGGGSSRDFALCSWVCGFAGLALSGWLHAVCPPQHNASSQSHPAHLPTCPRLPPHTQTQDPFWDEFFVFDVAQPAFAVLKIKVYDHRHCWRPGGCAATPLEVQVGPPLLTTLPLAPASTHPPTLPSLPSLAAPPLLAAFVGQVRIPVHSIAEFPARFAPPSWHTLRSRAGRGIRGQVQMQLFYTAVSGGGCGRRAGQWAAGAVGGGGCGRRGLWAAGQWAAGWAAGRRPSSCMRCRAGAVHTWACPASAPATRHWNRCAMRTGCVQAVRHTHSASCPPRRSGCTGRCVCSRAPGTWATHSRPRTCRPGCR